MTDDYVPSSLRSAEQMDEWDKQERDSRRTEDTLVSAARNVPQILSTVREIQDKIDYIGKNLGVMMVAVVLLLAAILMRVW